jgi:hypothetical protein
MFGFRLALALSLGVAVGAACSPVASAPTPKRDGDRAKARLLTLVQRENGIRADYDARTAPPWIDVSGSDPYRLVRVDAGFVALLRGSKALVRLDPTLSEVRRVALPEAPTALCVSGDEAWVGSRYSEQLLRVSLTRGVIVERERVEGGVADLACGGGEGRIYVLPQLGSELLTLSRTGGVLERTPAARGGLRMLRRGRFLLASSLFERSVRVWALTPAGNPARELARIQRDGPLWAFDALERNGELLIAVAGAEDKPLVRAHGEFENIDSYVWLHRLRGGALEELWSANASERGLVVPKALGLGQTQSDVSLTVLASGSSRSLTVTWRGELLGVPQEAMREALPGVADAVIEAGFVTYANPLFDAFVRVEPTGLRVVRVDSERRPPTDVRLGEALFFTELMAPFNTSQGGHSRFTCETCHFEGGVDGRVHYTGRADISVVTKPLFGLANNRPHFSRALDPNLSAVAHNEFRVAGAGSATDPWFVLDTARYSWLHELGIDRPQLEPLELRQALVEFLYAFSHAPNVHAQGRDAWTREEAAGAAHFRELCLDCHDARSSTDDATTRVPFDAWQAMVLSRNAPLVWATPGYAKTGILPYVHQQGTRVPSLRRLALKPRYFTNGSAPSLEDVLERFRSPRRSTPLDTGAPRALHDAPPNDADWAPLPASTRAELLSFLRVL